MQELLCDSELVALRGDPSVEVVSLEHDSRRVGPGDCFACIAGALTDGHRQAPAAIGAGAVALLVERPLALGVTEAQVPRVRAALGPAAARLHDWPSRAMRCVGVTGTNGKTTTTYLLEGIAREAGERVGVIGTTGARLAGESLPLERTTPEATELQALLAHMRDDGVETVAVEVSSHALVQHRVDGTWFAAVGFTNLSHDHLDFHGTVDEYFDAKALLFDPARAGAAVLNIDDPHGATLAVRARGRGLSVVTCAIEDRRADVIATEVRLDDRGAQFVLTDQRQVAARDVRIALLGRCNVMNSLVAGALGLVTGFDLDAVANGLSCPLVVPGRLESIRAGQPFAVVVDYAHTPDALAAALDAARTLAGPHRVILVFGCGGDRDRAKRPLMGRVAARDADIVIVTSDNPRSESPESIAHAILEGARTGRGIVSTELDRRAAIHEALEIAQAGDVVVIAGKGHETAQTTAGSTEAFDDRVVALELLGARSWN